MTMKMTLKELREEVRAVVSETLDDDARQWELTRTNFRELATHYSDMSKAVYGRRMQVPPGTTLEELQAMVEELESDASV